MSQNFTIDDTDATLFYGPGWGVASSNDPALGNYFQSTYHATQTSGANVSLSFVGVAIYLFGSKGPNHGNFSIRYDSFVQLLSAHADTLSYRQLLFSTHFQAGNHSITLTSTDNNQSWFDLDFITVTGIGNDMSSSSTTSSFSSTISPPSVVPTATEVSQSPPPSPSSSASTTVQVPSTSSPHTVTFILAIVFGILLFCSTVSAALYLIRRRRRRRGKPPYSPYGASSVENPRSVGSAGSAFFRSQSIKPSPPHCQPSFENSYRGPRPPQSQSQSQSHFNTSINFTERQSDVEMRQRGQSPGTPTLRPISPTSRSWSPFSSPLNRMFGTMKDGADSMKSTFLKV